MEKLDEKELYDLKWFDYRTLPVRGADLLFILSWLKVAAHYQAKCGYSRYAGWWIRKLDIKNYKKGKQIPNLIKLRQWADSRGLKYEYFWERAFEAHTNFAFKNSFPNAFLNKTILNYVSSESKKSGIIKYADFEFFKTDNYFGHEFQNDYYSYLIREVKNNYGNRAAGVVKELIAEGKMSVKFLKNIYTNK